jgi:hypothetical protein
LTSLLSPEQEKALQEIILLADQRKAALESKRIEQSGGKLYLIIKLAIDRIDSHTMNGHKSLKNHAYIYLFISINNIYLIFQVMLFTHKLCPPRLILVEHL